MFPKSTSLRVFPNRSGFFELYQFPFAKLKLIVMLFSFKDTTEAIYFVTSTFNNRFLTHLSWTNLHAFLYLIVNFSRSIYMGLLHTLLEFVSIFTHSKQLFVLDFCYKKLNLTTSRGILIFLYTCFVFIVIENLSMGSGESFKGKVRNILF